MKANTSDCFSMEKARDKIPGTAKARPTWISRLGGDTDTVIFKVNFSPRARTFSALGLGECLTYLCWFFSFLR